MIFDVMKANDKNDHDAADIVCNECKSVIATLHGPSAHRAGVRTGRAEKARAMAGQDIAGIPQMNPELTWMVGVF